MTPERRRALHTLVVALTVAASLPFVPGDASAHTRSVSYSNWSLSGTEATVVLKVALRDVTSLTTLPVDAQTTQPSSELTAQLQRAITLRDPRGNCAPASSAEPLLAERGSLRLRWTVRCAKPPTAIHSALFPDIGGHVHFANIANRTHLLTARNPDATITTATRASLSTFVMLGIEHILTGWDHVLFVLLLIVAARRLRDVAGLVTGFTIGHSITLALSALHFVVAFARPVEAAIAASIVVVAVENVWLAGGKRSWLPLLAIAFIAAVGWLAHLAAFAGVVLFTVCYFGLLHRRAAWSGWLRWPLACIFGLLHGFGFARVLTEQASTGAPELGSLLGFNVGVEIGQLGVVLLAWPVIAWLRRVGRHRTILMLASVTGAGVATYALIVRAFA